LKNSEKGHETSNYYFVGPLNLNRKTKKASTVWGKVFATSANEFTALDMLATNQGKPINFEMLYLAMSHMEDSSCDRDKARQELNNLMDQVNNEGFGFMRLEYAAETGYTFLCSWGHNWP